MFRGDTRRISPLSTQQLREGDLSISVDAIAIQYQSEGINRRYYVDGRICTLKEASCHPDHHRTWDSVIDQIREGRFTHSVIARNGGLYYFCDNDAVITARGDKITGPWEVIARHPNATHDGPELI